jgi:aspartyl/asparaginyl-tRNA synthetase
MLEAELAFSDNLEDSMSLAEDLVKAAAARMLDKCPDDVASLTKINNSNIKVVV